VSVANPPPTGRKACGRFMNSRNKGKVGERELANTLKEMGFATRRGVQYSGGAESPDVVGIPGVHIECKRVESLNIEKAFWQSERECGSSVPTVFHRRNRTDWKVTVKLADLERFIDAWKKAKSA